MSGVTSRDESCVESSVFHRYSAAAETVEAALCCPVKYASELLDVIPREIIEKDYGCGDPTAFAGRGDTVLDLGSGAGKMCYMLAQIVGHQGRVIGVDTNAHMIALARKYQDEITARLGYNNVEFRYGLIQDLRLDLERLSLELSELPVCDAADWLRLRQLEDLLRAESPLIADDSVDCVVSNCVLNLVRKSDREQLFGEIFRVLRNGGRAAISDIVCDEDVPPEMQQDGRLWSGCISGAYREDRLLEAFETAGFHGISIARRQSEPWQVVNGLEFRSMTIVAYKGKQGPCWERNQAVVYRGPFKQVEDDDGHRFVRGQRVAVCDKTFHLLQRAPYAGLFEPILPREELPLESAVPFDCGRAKLRDPRETKGAEYHATVEASGTCCSTSESCC